MNPKEGLLTQERLREMLSYDPETGVFRWLVARGGQYAGVVAGSNAHHGYQIILIFGKRYYAHRLAWLWMTGEWPKQDMDHIDGNPANNRWSNLRSVTTSQNSANRRKSRNNRSGYKGVWKHSQTGKYYVNIKFEGEDYRDGPFDTAEEAHQVYVDLAKEIHGEFARWE